MQRKNKRMAQSSNLLLPDQKVVERFLSSCSVYSKKALFLSNMMTIWSCSQQGLSALRPSQKTSSTMIFSRISASHCFIACTPSNQLLFLSHTTSKADNWNQFFIVEQIQQVVSLLRSQNVNVSQFYLDDCLLFDQIKEVLVLDPQVGHFPILGNTIEWCQDLLNTLFSFPLLMGIKQSVHFRIRCVRIGDGGLYELSKERVSHRTLQRAIPRSL